MSWLLQLQLQSKHINAVHGNMLNTRPVLEVFGSCQMCRTLWERNMEICLKALLFKGLKSLCYAIKMCTGPKHVCMSQLCKSTHWECYLFLWNAPLSYLKLSDIWINGFAASSDFLPLTSPPCWSLCRHQWVSEPWYLQSDLHQPERRIQVRVSQWLPNGSNYRSLQSCWWVHGWAGLFLAGRPVLSSLINNSEAQQASCGVLVVFKWVMSTKWYI